jgi:hypothetical protein
MPVMIGGARLESMSFASNTVVVAGRGEVL